MRNIYKENEDIIHRLHDAKYCPEIVICDRCGDAVSEEKAMYSEHHESFLFCCDGCLDEFEEENNEDTEEEDDDRLRFCI
jgi:hypothetical protein